jgi:hypothetical protein
MQLDAALYGRRRRNMKFVAEYAFARGRASIYEASGINRSL